MKNAHMGRGGQLHVGCKAAVACKPAWMLCAALFLLHSQAALAAEHEVPLFMSASNPTQQGFVRIINRSGESGTVRIHAIDDSGRRGGPVTLSMNARATTHFNSGDLENGNQSKGLSGRTGGGDGDWRLQLETDLDIEALAYIRTTDGFLTSMHDSVPGEHSESGFLHLVPIFNPGSNRNQVSSLRLINPNAGTAEVVIAGVDDRGATAPLGEVNLTLAGGEARTITAQEIEAGGTGFNGRFGDGAGKWWLLVATDQPISVMSLLESPTGNLTNLSTYGADQGIPLFMSASNPTQQGFVRVTNYTEQSGAVSFYAVDDAGRRFGPINLSLGARETVHFNSSDLENGNARKGLARGVGNGQGDWRLEWETDLKPVGAFAYIRTSDGFLTSVHDIVSSAQNRHHVPIFNPGSNNDQRSSLRLVNPGGEDAEVVVTGLDDRGRPPPNGDVRLTLPAGEARMFTAQEIEAGGTGFSGRFGDGGGKWQLSVSADQPIQVMSLLQSPTGNLTNLSTSAAPLASPNAAPVAQDISLRSDLSNPILEVQLMGTDADGDALTYVLHSAPEGDGYYDAFVEPESGQLFVRLRDDGQEQVTIAYQATDGMRFSNVAYVRIAMEPIESGGLGLSAADPATYGRIPIEFFDSPTLPLSIDLSANFPPAGMQGMQNSCVGWAVGYALKSFQERLEEGWEFGPTTMFSPAWIYNQIVIGRDQGSLIEDALKLIVDRGAATWSTMPYDRFDYRSQPTTDATREAGRYKAMNWRSVRSTQQIKAALFNRLPVVVGMQVYDAFNRLTGTNSVYHTFSGPVVGAHAVTIVGYDDELFGGAFKVINSYGTSWGDGGYFWLPYEHLGRVVSEAYVLQDKENGPGPPPNVPDRPALEDLPNLRVANWRAEYNSQPGGAGSWQWTVINTGTATAPRGADVNLILSRDRFLDSSDWWVQYEEIPFDLEPGKSAVRDETNPRPFTFPQTLSAGTYYLAVWVDDLQEVRESNENDNVSGSDLVEITAPNLPDLAINYWWASWDDNGTGVLEYEIVNNGTAPTTRTDWGVNLILSYDEIPRARRYRYLFTESAGHILNPRGRIYRDESHQASFNLLRDYFGNPVPAGTYYLSLWVDDLNQEQESNEINNLSVGNQLISISQASFSKDHAAKSDQGGSAASDASSVTDTPGTASVLLNQGGNATVNASSAFNGRRLPAGIAMKKVEILDNPDGTRSMVFSGDAAQSSATPNRRPIKPLRHGQAEAPSRYEKVIRAADQVVFPRGEVKHMP